ncbi:MAG TPA: proton-conducting transporter membrane subunit [Gemmatimonadales bacterium]|nr:proton-conducting transporter membrane subunit [Gemmatimonadales bacterium]
MLVAVSLLLMVTGGVAAAGLARRPTAGERWFRLCFGAGCVIGAVPAVAVLAGAAVPDVRLAAAAPLGAWVFGLDALSAVFLLAILSAGAACAFYGLAYLDRERGHRAVGAAHLLLALLVTALAVAVIARAAAPFLIAWEVMAVTAYLLVVLEHERSEVRRAGLIYLAVTHAGTLLLFALFATWAGDAGDLSFAALGRHPPFMAGRGAMILVLALVAFGLKAGVVPFHFWLPEAHAAAPAHVSALMSGVVIKMGIYGLLRTVVLFGPPPPWWGWVVLVLGACSGVLGVVWALAQHDIKRLLAFHSVENVGIILLGIGAGALGLAYGHPLIAVLGFAGAALHTLNHALFKSLLFLGAGSVIHATGGRDIDLFGGVARRMPTTAAAFLVGSAAIVGLPPLNGFVSEWVVFQALLRGGSARDAMQLAGLAAVALALIGALALACFVKVVGVLYLGTPRDLVATTAREPASGMIRPVVGLAIACVAIGLLPIAVVPAALRAGSLVAGVAPGVVGPEVAAAGPATVFTLGLTASLVVAWAAHAALARRQPRLEAATWGCGYATATSRMAYTASSFAAPLLGIFQSVAGVRTARAGDAFATHPTDPVLERLIVPAWRGVRAAATGLRPIQRGGLQLYLLYVVAAVVTVLLYLLAAGRAL